MTSFPPAPGTHRARVHAALDGAAVDGGHVAARWLSGVALFRSRNGAHALKLLADESRRVRGIAMCAAPLACDDAQATEALHVAWQVRRERRLLRRMARQRRTRAIDGFLDRLAEARQLRDLVDDLAFGSQAAVRRHLQHALDRPSERFWAGLAVAHPAVLGELLLARWCAATGEADPVTRQLTARHHPRIALRAADLGVELADVLLSRGIEPAVPVWTELLRQRPRATVELAVRHDARVPDGVFARRFDELAPELLARVIANSPHLLGDFGPRVRRLAPERRRALADGWLAASARFPVHGAYLLAYLPDDAAREVGYERWSLAARDRDGAIDPTLVAALPIELAAREARRHVGDVVALATSPARRLARIARYLPWQELELALRDHLGHPDGALRALALAELVANPGVYPDDATLPARALEVVVARKFEQDPVRLVMFGALAQWPRRVWRAEHLPAVARAVRDALDAADLSAATAQTAERLVARLFGVDPVWAATWLATLIKERGTLHAPNLGAALNDADIRAAAPQLLAIAKSWATSERTPWLIQLALGLGHRLRLVAGLDELLAHVRDVAPHEVNALQLTWALADYAPERHAATLVAALTRLRKRGGHVGVLELARRDGLAPRARRRERHRRRPTLQPAIASALVEIARELDTRYAPQALELLRQRDPRSFDGVVAEILQRDASAVTIACVRSWIHRHRQDLLDGLLGERVIEGKWATGKTRWILPFDDGFFRWAPAQVERFATAVGTIVADRDRDLPTVIAMLSKWPAMEYAAMDRLCAVATDERPAVRERAVRVLARCDAGQGVPTLLACLADDRARFAIYGLRRALFGMFPDHALGLLAAVPMKKVTVAKEVVRLTGALRAAGAFARVLELANGSLHRDVRIAVLRALWDHLDRDDTWALFERAVADPDWVVASRLADIPADRLTVTLDARLAARLGGVVARPEPEARIGLLQRAAYLALVDRDRSLLRAIFARLSSPFDDEVRAAMSAALARATEADMPALTAAFDGLRADPRALHVAGMQLCAHDIRSRASWRLAATALETVAARDPRWAVLAVRAAAARGIAAELVAALEQLTLDHDASFAADVAIDKLDDDDLDATVASLAASARSRGAPARGDRARPRGAPRPRLERRASARARAATRRRRPRGRGRRGAAVAAARAGPRVRRAITAAWTTSRSACSRAGREA